VGEQGNGVAFDGESRKAIGDGNRQIIGGWLQLGNGVRVEGPAKIRPPEIHGAVGRVGPKLQDGNGGWGKDDELTLKPLCEGR
jgi:hypothetical protein